MMTRTVMIDLPSVMNAKWKIQGENYLAIIDYLKELKGVEIIYREDILFDYASYEEMSLLIDVLGRIKSKVYSLNDLHKAKYTLTNPQLQEKSFPNELNNEICLQAYTLHPSPNTLFIVSRKRWAHGSADLQTIKDKHAIEHKTLVAEDQKSLDSYLTSQRPRLEQRKHTTKGYSVSGQDISPFTAYNSQNEEPAKRLLQNAYELYAGNEIFPKYLYAWDSNNKTFVEFRRSTTDGAYHGFDCNREDVEPELLTRLHK